MTITTSGNGNGSDNNNGHDTTDACGSHTIKKKVLTLVFVFRRVPAADTNQRRQILLGMKKRGFGRDKWNGFGGKVEPKDKSIAHAAVRELEEEAGIQVQVDDLTQAGLIHFKIVNRPELLEVHVFTTDNFQGVPCESEEMLPQWYDLDTIPFDQMWSDDQLWLPSILDGKFIQGKVDFSQDEATILDYSIQEFDPQEQSVIW